MMKKFKLSILLFVISLTAYCQKPEFRGVWIATVVNIDWPSNGNASNEQKKEEFLNLLKFYKDLNFNAVIVQIRTAGDAFYPSALAPYSRYLTGKEGQAPAHNFDFTQWMVEQTHLHGMEFHAWLNPYRATFSSDKNSLSPQHDLFKHPDWMIYYGNKYYYDPGNPAVEAHLLNICAEILNNYDIDALHFDDYFYPYKIGKKEFNDRSSYLKYRKPHQSLEEWRRANVDSLIYKIHYLINDIKPWVDFGISPFGVWRNQSQDARGSNTRAGQTNYDDLYADILLWTENAWIDYLVPQLYWSMNHSAASYKILNQWWSDNFNNTNTYIGNGPYKIKNDRDRAWNNPTEIPNQVILSQNTQNIQGNVFFSAKSLIQHEQVAKLLKQKVYSSPALVPKTKKIKQVVSIPKIIEHDAMHATIEIESPNDMRWLCIYYKDYNTHEWVLKDKIFVAANENKIHIDLDPFIGLENHAFSLIDKYKNESEKIFILEHTPQMN